MTAREIRAPRGTELSCRSWPQEAAMRMLMNNLDPDVAERPEDLVVYGGTGRAARSWEAYDAIVRTLQTLRDDETLLVQSGKPVGVFRTHAMAPRVLISNSMLVPKWADWDTFRELEAAGLTMYGQMTAGSWIYIGTQGILQGTYETLAECAQQRFGGTLQGTVTLTGGLGGMGGAQPLAVTMNGGVALCIEVDPARIERRVKTRYLDRETDDLDTALAWVRRGAVGWGGGVDRAPRQLRRGRARAPATRVAARHRHRSDERARSARRVRARRAHVGGRGRAARRRPRRLSASRARVDGRARRRDGRVPRRGRGRVRLRQQPAGGRGARRHAARPRVRVPGVRAGVRAAALLRGQGPVPLGGALRRSRGHRRRPTAPSPSSSPTTSGCSAGSGWPRSGWPTRDCRRGSAGSDTANARRPVSASTRWLPRASCPRRS